MSKNKMIGSLLLSLSVFISSFVRIFWLFVIIYGIIFGFISSVMYMMPVFDGFLYFPKKKGTVSGIILVGKNFKYIFKYIIKSIFQYIYIIGYGMGTFIFSLIFTKIVNPDNLSPIKAEDGSFYFSGDAASVAERVPSGLRYLSLIYLILCSFGSYLVKEPPEYKLNLEIQHTAELSLEMQEVQRINKEYYKEKNP